MKQLILFFLCFFCAYAAEAQKKKRSAPVTYSGCEIEMCYSSHTIHFSQDSTVMTQTRSHQYSSDFFMAGKWTVTKTGVYIAIDERKRTGRLSNLSGTYHRVSKSGYEFLIKESSLTDTTQIIEAAMKHWEQEKPDGISSETMNKLKSKIMSDYIRQNFSWKLGLLVKDFEK